MWPRYLLALLDSWTLVGMGGDIHLVRGPSHFGIFWKGFQVPLHVGPDGLMSDFACFFIACTKPDAIFLSSSIDLFMGILQC